MAQQKHMTITVSGRVQGVFFRASVKKKADRLGITGLVRNQPSGEVYLEVEGNEQALRNLIAWCASGPRLATVTSVRTEPGELKHFRDFVIAI
jgi:acylphosphatase